MRHKSHVQDWMTRDPLTVTAETSVFETYDMMRRRRVRRLLVVDDQGRLQGIVTQSDIEQAMPLARNADSRREAAFELAGMTVDEVMTRNPICVAPTTAVAAVAAEMIRSKVSGLPVVDGGTLVGIITESDIFRLVVETWDEDDA